jgi:hypothetical protein
MVPEPSVTPRPTPFVVCAEYIPLAARCSDVRPLSLAQCRRTFCATLSAFAQRLEVGDGSAAYEMEHACIPVSDAIRDDADKALRSDSDWLQAGGRALGRQARRLDVDGGDDYVSR